MTDRYYPDIVDDNLEMQQAIQRVRELHSPQTIRWSTGLEETYCSCDNELNGIYPCPTIKALEGKQ